MKPKVLWLTYDLPYPTNSGGKLRSYNLIKHLSHEFEVDLFSFYRRDEQMAHLEELYKIVNHLRVFKRRYIFSPENLFKASISFLPLLNVSYLDFELEEELRAAARLKEYQIYHFEFLGMASYLPLVKSLRGLTVFGNENIEYQIYQNYTQRSRMYPLLPFFGYDVWKMRRLERSYWEKADLNLVVSEEDAQIVAGVSSKPCVVVPNGVDLSSPEIQEISSDNKILSPMAFFSGNLVYQQNKDALFWFLKEVTPIILKKLKQFKVVVLSDRYEDFLKDFTKIVILESNPQETFENLAKKCSVFIAPIRIKSGTNIKVLQAMADGLPVVATPEALTGYDFTPGQDVLIGYTAEDFAEKVVMVLGNDELSKKLVFGAYEKVKRYSWENSAKILINAYRKALS